MTFQRFVGVATLATSRVEKLRAGEERLVQKARGYPNLVVNSQVLMEDSEHTGVYPGRVLCSHTAVPA